MNQTFLRLGRKRDNVHGHRQGVQMSCKVEKLSTRTCSPQCRYDEYYTELVGVFIDHRASLEICRCLGRTKVARKDVGAFR